MKNTTMNFEELKVVELKELCRKAGISGFSKMKKAELVDALNNSKELKKNIVNEARDNAKNELNRDFGRAVSFWKQLRNLKAFSANDYAEMTENWKILMSLFTVANGNSSNENRAITDNLMDTAISLRDIFYAGTDISNYTEDNLREFVDECLNAFSLSVFSKRLKKENTEIIKMSMEHIGFDSNGKAYFDSSKAAKFTGKEVKAHKTDMRIVESAEDGISRMLADRNLTSVTVFMGLTAAKEEEMKLLNDRKENIFRNGFVDIATEKHYMFAFQNPSSCRKANFMFVEANTWEDVESLWYEITGLDSTEAFKEAGLIGDDYHTVMAKFLARVSTRGSNSFNLTKISPAWSEKIKACNVLDFDDPEIKIIRDFKTPKGPGCLELQQGVERTVTPGDGQMIGSFEFHALLAVAMRVISENEYNEFLTLWAKVDKDVKNVKEGSRLYRLINKIPGVFQLRHGEKKGICVRYNLEAIPELAHANALVPKSVRKFISGTWADFDMEICNYLKRKDEWVAMNPQFIQALEYGSPNALNDIVRYWFNFMEESLNDIAKAQQFHGIMKSSDDEDNRTIASNLVAAMRTSSDLIDDAQICNWRRDQYRKFISDMKIGRLMVPGQYTYMVCDPAMIISKVYGIDLPHLNAGEFYFNGKECECGLFRSPLIHPFEAQRVKLFNNENYWYMHDVIVFNGYDGTWDRMGGADFDGDTCAVVPDDTEFGAIIVKGIRCLSYDIWEPAQKAIKREFTRDNLIAHLVNSAKVDRTGVITNYASKALDISNHLKSAIYFAKDKGCDTITLIHPKAFNEAKDGQFGCNYGPRPLMINGKMSFCMKGIVEARYDSRTSTVEFLEPGHIGTYTFDQITDLSNKYLDLVEILRVLQGREIDGAKTGVYAEGVNGDEFIDAVKVNIIPHEMIVRQETLSRDVSLSAKINQYHSVSPLARVHDLSCINESKIMDFFENGTNKVFTLLNLLSKEEHAALEQKYAMSDGSQSNLVEIMVIRKRMYNGKIYEVMKNLSGDDASTTLKSIKESEVAELVNLANAIHVDMQLVAVAGYIATYTKDSKQSEGLSYGWLLFDELLSVFSRGNKKYELFRLPESVDSVSIKEGFMYINGNKSFAINASDCENVVIQIINSRNYALVHKNVPVVAEEYKSDVVYGTTVYTIGVNGFKYHIKCEATEDPKAIFKKIVRENHGMFDIVSGQNGRTCIAVNGKTIAALMTNDVKNILLNKDIQGKRVRLVSGSTFDETSATITNLKVCIIGEATPIIAE